MGCNVAVIVLGKRDVVVSAVSCGNVMLLPFIASLEKDLGDALKTYPARYPHAFSCPHSQHTLMYTLIHTNTYHIARLSGYSISWPP